jgi:hypothetical protein
MADTRAAFAGTEDANGNGIPTGNAIDNTTVAAALNGQIGFAFKSSAGNVILPQLNSKGEILVSTDGPTDSTLNARGTAAGSGTAVAVVTLALATSTVYSMPEVSVACRHGGFFQLIWNNNGVNTILADILLDAGQYTFKEKLDNISFTSGGTGTQQLLVNGNNWGSGSGQLSAMYATVAIVVED